MKTKPEILVIRLSAFGDIIHMLPALAALKQALPAARLCLLVKERFAAFVRRAPFLDEVWTRVERPVDLAVDCQGLLRTAWIALRSGARETVGAGWRDIREKPAAFLYRRRVPLTASHIIDRHAQLLAGAVGMPFTVDPAFRAGFLVRPDEAAERFLAGLPGPRVLVHPFSSQEGKHLRVEEWRPILKDLSARGFSLILSCGPGEEALLAPWREAAPGAVAAPILPLTSLPALVAGCRLMLGTDTGILHLADQLGVPCLSWFSLWPPERNGPYFSPRLVFWRRPPDLAETSRWLDSLPR